MIHRPGSCLGWRAAIHASLPSGAPSGMGVAGPTRHTESPTFTPGGSERRRRKCSIRVRKERLSIQEGYDQRAQQEADTQANDDTRPCNYWRSEEGALAFLTAANRAGERHPRYSRFTADGEGRRSLIASAKRRVSSLRCSAPGLPDTWQSQGGGVGDTNVWHHSLRASTQSANAQRSSCGVCCDSAIQ